MSGPEVVDGREFVLGIDAGASRVRAVAMDREGRVRGRAKAPAAEPPEASEGERPEAPERKLEETSGERAAERAGRLAAVATEALRTAGLRAPVAALCAGVAGLDPGTRRVLRSALEERGLAARVRLTTDAEVAHFDAFRDGPGILLAAGTGSVAWGRGPGGREGRVGGLGPLLGDDGSGWDLARRALRAAARAAEGRGPSTDLLPLLAARLGTEEDGRALAAAAAGRTEAGAPPEWPELGRFPGCPRRAEEKRAARPGEGCLRRPAADLKDRVSLPRSLAPCRR